MAKTRERHDNEQNESKVEKENDESVVDPHRSHPLQIGCMNEEKEDSVVSSLKNGHTNQEWISWNQLTRRGKTLDLSSSLPIKFDPQIVI